MYDQTFSYAFYLLSELFLDIFFLEYRTLNIWLDNIVFNLGQLIIMVSI
jgi:hypothetical protein